MAVPPELGDDERLGWTCAGMGRAGTLIDRYRAENELLAKLPAPPAMAETAGLEGVMVLLAGLRQSADGARRRYRALGQLDEPPEVQPTAPLASTIEKLGRAEGAARAARRRNTVLIEVKAPPEQVDPAPLESLIRRRLAADGEVARLRTGLNDLHAELAGVAVDVRRWSRTHPTCPLCGAATDAERILAGDHAHD